MSKIEDKFEDSRREFLVRLLASGAYAGVAPTLLFQTNAWAEKLDQLPGPLADGRSIYDMKGKVTINGVSATKDTIISANDTIETGRRSYIIFVVGKDAFILRSNSTLKLSSEDETEDIKSQLQNNIVNSLRLVTGKLLSVFGKTRHKISTPTATIGIRGTGVYVESDPEESYVCTCYGTTIISAINDQSSIETITSQQHDAPRYITASGSAGQLIRPAPFKNHDDSELLLIEELVGRQVPFPVPAGRRRSSLSPY
jgi:hypothetical protein